MPPGVPWVLGRGRHTGWSRVDDGPGDVTPFSWASSLRSVGGKGVREVGLGTTCPWGCRTLEVQSPRSYPLSERDGQRGELPWCYSSWRSRPYRRQHRMGLRHPTRTSRRARSRDVYRLTVDNPPSLSSSLHSSSIVPQPLRP